MSTESKDRNLQIFTIAILAMLLGGGLMFLLMSGGSRNTSQPTPEQIGQPQPQPQPQAHGGPPAPPQLGTPPAQRGTPPAQRATPPGRGTPPAPPGRGAPAAPAGQGQPPVLGYVRQDYDNRVDKLDKGLQAKTPAAVQAAADDMRSWLASNAELAAIALGGTVGSRLVKDNRALDTFLELADPALAAANAQRPAGAIGVGTWNTSAQFADIRVEKAGQVLYASDFASASGLPGSLGWRAEGGQWSLRDGALCQTSTSGNAARIYIGDESWSDYSLSLRARKVSGAEGFQIVFGRKGNISYWWNLGGWSNKEHGIELEHLELCPRVAGSIADNRWYNIRVELSGPRVRCLLDGQVIHDFDVGGTTAAAIQRWAAVCRMEKGQRTELLAQVNACLASGGGSTLMADIVQPLMGRRQYDSALEVTQAMLLAAPENTSMVQAALKQRIAALKAKNDNDGALAAAKMYFNYAALADTGDALTLLYERLAAARPDKMDLFRQEQEAGSRAPAGQAEPNRCTVLAEIALDAGPFVAAAGQLAGTDYNTLIKRGALLLLGGEADQAMSCFTQALSAASTTQRQSGTAWIARCIKAQDGTIGRANALAAGGR
jgi:hypothetical protein